MNQIARFCISLIASFGLAAGVIPHADAATAKPAKKPVAAQKKTSSTAAKPAKKPTAAKSTAAKPKAKPVATAAAKAKTAKAAKAAKAKSSSANRNNQRVATPKPRKALPPPPPVVIPSVIATAVASDLDAVAKDVGSWVDMVGASPQITGLSVAVVKDNQIIFKRGVGVTDTATRAPVKPETVFRLASLSKAFASTLAGLMVRDGVIRWDTRIVSLLPTFALADTSGEKLTVMDIMSQRVGLPHNAFDNSLESDEPYPLLVDRLRSVPLNCPVGACYGYQNIAFSLIGDVTYAATGNFFHYQVEKRLFHPLGMNTATYGREALEASASWARPHVRAGKNAWRTISPKENYYRVPPAAGINASINDMSQWLIAQMGGRPDVLPADLLTELHAPLVDTPRELRGSPWRRGRLNDAHYGLGWRVFDYAGEPMVFHGGAVQGYRSVIAFLPKQRFGLVMLWNTETALPTGLLPMVMDRYLGLPSVNWAGIQSEDDGDISATGGD